MKAILTAAILITSAATAFADFKQKPISDAEVVVFDAICTATSPREGFLKVELQLESAELSMRGNFFSSAKAPAQTDPENEVSIPLQECQQVRDLLLQNVGRKIHLRGQYSERSHTIYVDIQGHCGGSPRLRETYPCVIGTRPVIKKDREVTLNAGGIPILNKNN